MSKIAKTQQEIFEMPRSNRIDKIQGEIKQEFHDIVEGTGKIVVLDFVAGFFLIFLGISIVGLPLGTLVALLLVIYKSFSSPRYIVPQSNIYIAVMLLGLFYITYVSLTTGYSTPSETARRLVRISAIVLLSLYIGDRRIDMRSLILGTGVAMVFNSIAFYAGVAPDTYSGYLSGWFGDKNVAGLYHAVIPLILFILYTKRWQRILLVVVSLPLLWETGSRTSIAGFMMGVLWLFFAQKLNLFFKIFLAAFVVWLFEWLQTNFADSVLFGDRSGSDWFREQIDEASLAKLQETDWHGRGFGEAFVTLDNGRIMLFHNSVWTLLVEGGWPWFIAIVGITLLSVFVWKQSNETQRMLGAEALTVLLAICSWRLGEVILTAPWAFAVGMALSYSANKKRKVIVSVGKQ